jgi:ABC-type spermidine/putrescine transport system permease subunit I
VRTLAKTVIMGAGVTAICLVIAIAVAYFLARYVSRRWGALCPARDHRPVLVELSATRVFVASDPWVKKGALNQLLMGLG